MGKEVHSIIVGMGEVGQALKNVLEDKYEVFGVDVNTKDLPESCKALNICIPYSKDFINIVNNYVDKFKPVLTVNHSSVPVGTTKLISGNVVHSPIRGKHPQLTRGIKKYVKYIGYNDQESNDYASNYFRPVFTYSLVPNSDTTEFMKLASLAFYGVMLGLTDELSNMAKKIDVDYGAFKDWILTQNSQVDNFYPCMQWPILNPPKGRIGGHCVMPINRMIINDKRFSAPIILSFLSKYQDL